MRGLAREIEIGTRLVLEAGDRVMSWYGRAAAEAKAGDEPVTAADREANAFLVEQISAAFPEDGILAEESGAEAGWKDKRRRWFIDPVDGTKEFIAQNGEFAVMVGLAEEGAPALGFVLLPAKRLLYWGGPGLGAFRRSVDEGEEIGLEVGEIVDPKEMTMAVSRSHRSRAVDEAARLLGIERQIVSGSVGIKLGMVASREADLYLHPASGTRLWDACGPDAIIRGAGGILTDCRGRPVAYEADDFVNRSGLVASNGRSHDLIIETILPIIEEEGL